MSDIAALLGLIQEEIEGRYLIEIPATEEIMSWASGKFTAAIGITTDPISQNIRALPGITILDINNRNAIDIASAHLYDHAIAVIHHRDTSAYDTIMVTLKRLLMTFWVICIIIDCAGSIRDTLTTLLDDKFDVEWFDDDIVVIFKPLEIG